MHRHGGLSLTSEEMRVVRTAVGRTSFAGKDHELRRSVQRKINECQIDEWSARKIHEWTAEHYLAGTCDIRVGDWPYDCDSKRDHPDHTVYICHAHNAWWHEDSAVA